MTRERISLTFDPRDMFFLLQIGFSVKAAVACAILERTSGLEPSYETTVLRHSNLYGPIFCPFTLISLRIPLAQFVISLVFSALIYILCPMPLSILSTRASNSCTSSARESMSSAYSRLVIFLPPMLTLLPCCSRASDMIRLKKNDDEGE